MRRWVLSWPGRRRRGPRQQLRDQSEMLTVVLPSTAGELSRLLASLEELLLDSRRGRLTLYRGGHGGSVATRPTRRAAWRASWGRRTGRAGRATGRARRRFELVPLFFVPLARLDWGPGRRRGGRVGAERHGFVDPVVDDTISGYALTPARAAELVQHLRRLAVCWTRQRRRCRHPPRSAHRGAVPGRVQPIILTAAEQGAYQRVAARVLAAWFDDDTAGRAAGERRETSPDSGVRGRYGRAVGPLAGPGGLGR